MSPVRDLLAAAQAAELRGDVPEATRLLREAAAFFRDHQAPKRALQMLRQIRRLEGTAGDEDPFDGFSPAPSIDELEPAAGAWFDDPEPSGEFGFGDGLMESDGETPGAAARSTLSRQFQRGPTLAPPDLEAWCSFCCRPRQEVGSLVAGPAGAFICRECLATSARLMGDPLGGTAPARPVATAVASASAPTLLPSQARHLERLQRRSPKVTLVLGPPASGKTTVLRAVAEPASRPLVGPPSATLLALDLGEPLSEDEAKLLLTWLGAAPNHRLVVAAPGDVPAPALLVPHPEGPEPLFDSASLHRAVAGWVPLSLVAQVDLVVPLAAPDGAALEALAQVLTQGKRGLPAELMAQVIALAARSARPLEELTSLIRRLPSHPE